MFPDSCVRSNFPPLKILRTGLFLNCQYFLFISCVCLRTQECTPPCQDLFPFHQILYSRPGKTKYHVVKYGFPANTLDFLVTSLFSTLPSVTTSEYLFRRFVFSLLSSSVHYVPQSYRLTTYSCCPPSPPPCLPSLWLPLYLLLHVVSC